MTAGEQRFIMVKAGLVLASLQVSPGIPAWAVSRLRIVYFHTISQAAKWLISTIYGCDIHIFG